MTVVPGHRSDIKNRPPSGRALMMYGLLINDQPTDLLLQIIELGIIEKGNFYFSPPEYVAEMKAELTKRIIEIRGDS